MLESSLIFLILTRMLVLILTKVDNFRPKMKFLNAGPERKLEEPRTGSKALQTDYQEKIMAAVIWNVAIW